MKSKIIIPLMIPALLLCSCEAKIVDRYDWQNITEEAANEYIARIKEKVRFNDGFEISFKQENDYPSDSAKSHSLEGIMKGDTNHNLYLQVKGYKASKYLEYEMYFIYGATYGEEFHVRRYDESAKKYIVESFYYDDCKTHEEVEEYNDLTQEYRNQFGKICISYLHDMEYPVVVKNNDKVTYTFQKNLIINGFHYKEERSDFTASIYKPNEEYTVSEKTDMYYENDLPYRYVYVETSSLGHLEVDQVDVKYMGNVEFTVPASWGVKR